MQGGGSGDRDVGGLVGEERHAAGLAHPGPELRRGPGPGDEHLGDDEQDHQEAIQDA